jgi:hypothetical protein
VARGDLVFRAARRRAGVCKGAVFVFELRAKAVFFLGGLKVLGASCSNQLVSPFAYTAAFQAPSGELILRKRQLGLKRHRVVSTGSTDRPWEWIQIFFFLVTSNRLDSAGSGGLRELGEALRDEPMRKGRAGYTVFEFDMFPRSALSPRDAAVYSSSSSSRGLSHRRPAVLLWCFCNGQFAQTSVGLAGCALRLRSRQCFLNRALGLQRHY